MRPTYRFIVVLCLLVVAVGGCQYFMSEPEIDFSTQVKPILNNKCISCHGGVKAKAGFSVLFQEEALGKTESGKPAIIPGDPDNSELIRRITLNDPEERMPYKHAPLSQHEVDILRRWIKEGAKWGDHWAYLPVKKVTVPELDDPGVINDIDKFILSKLADNDLSFSKTASKDVLLRRVSLDLIGMLPPDSVSKKFLEDKDAGAYERLVDDLLASPRYGERWASLWLDLARYADTRGYEKDGNKNIWRYRDWVIDAFNEDKPYDVFITEQIAGDLAPFPTDKEYLATAFSRNSLTNDEGGTDNEEFRTAAVMDRVNATWEGLMGTTFACVQCHSHPYDPFRHDEYYKFMAYFNNTRDEDVNGDYPLLREFDTTAKEQITHLTNWVKKYGTEDQAKKTNLLLRTLQPAVYAGAADSMQHAGIQNHNGDLMIANYGSFRIKQIDLENVDQLAFKFYSHLKNSVLELRRDSADGPLITSQKIDGNWKWEVIISRFPKQSGVHDIYFTYYNSNAPKVDNKWVAFAEWFVFSSALPGQSAEGYQEKDRIFQALIREEVPGIPVMVENSENMPRPTFVFERGNWREKTKQVTPAVPETLAFAMPENAPADRKGLAMWLTDKKNPLVSRTMTNRLWEQLFGTGIVETLEDMGTQGMLPSHAQLLDYLSWQFMNEHQWSVKKMLKQLVMSGTYKQDSRSTPELTEKDPYNRLYARGPRFRLSAEQIRDQHLRISGVLSEKMYGPGVMPWQPDGIWQSPYNSARWQNSIGEDRYRRAVYTFLKRSAPYPSMIAFDGAQRVVCNARRIRTNTPLQALVTLNDSAYVDMAGHFARRMAEEGGEDIRSRIEKGYERMLYKKIPEDKLQVFTDLYKTGLELYRKNPDDIKLITGSDSTTADEAAMIVVANSMLNIDEVLTKN